MKPILKRDYVKETLIKYHLPNEWLINMLNTYYDLNVYKAELTKTLNGTMKTNKSYKILNASIHILHSYENWDNRLAKSIAVERAKDNDYIRKN